MPSLNTDFSTPTLPPHDPNIDHGYFLLVLEEILLALCSLLLLNRYGEIKSLNLIITISVTIAWWLALNVVLLLPLDVSVSLYEQCGAENMKRQEANDTTQAILKCGRPWNYVTPHSIRNLWRIVYWGSFTLSWILLPFLQSYNNSGYFTTAGRLKQAVGSG